MREKNRSRQRNVQTQRKGDAADSGDAPRGGRGSARGRTANRAVRAVPGRCGNHAVQRRAARDKMICVTRARRVRPLSDHRNV